MAEESNGTPADQSFRFEWGGVHFEVHGSDRLVEEGFELLESEILPRLESTGVPVDRAADISEEGAGDEGEADRDESLTPMEFMADKEPDTAYEKATALSYYAKFYQGADVMTADELDTLITQAQLDDFGARDALYDAERRGGYMEKTGRGKFELTQTGIRYVKNQLGAA